MLFIYSSIQLGGIETFILRISRTRFLMGKKTKILLIANKKKNDKLLINEIKKYAEIYFIEDFYKYKFYKYLPTHLIFIKNIKFKEMTFLFEDISQIHVANSICGLLYKKISDKLNVKLPLTIGIYHSKEFTWQFKKLPYFERINRALFEKLLSISGVIFFNDKLPKKYSKYYNIEFSKINLFPLGVIENTLSLKRSEKNKKNNILKIVSVGRLVNFKTYNLYMIDIINSLKDKYNIEYYVYGDGPLHEEMFQKIKKYSLENRIFLKGSLSYDKLLDTLQEFDLFIGSGTAIIDASSLGVPSIIAIENNYEPTTYGYVSNILGFTYHEDGLYNKVPIEKVIKEFYNYNHGEIYHLKHQHIKWAEKFSMDKCVVNFENSIKQYDINQFLELKINNFQYFKYSISFFLFELLCRVKGKSSSDIIYGEN